MEAEIAFVLLGIAMAGLLPLVVVQLKLARVLGRANPQSYESPTAGATTYLSPNRTYYLVPPTLTDPADPTSLDSRRTTWIRKLGASASLSTSDSGFDDSSIQTPVAPTTTKSLEILEPPVRSTVDDTVSLKVIVR